jgi:hypothetical protein
MLYPQAALGNVCIINMVLLVPFITTTFVDKHTLSNVRRATVFTNIYDVN